MVAANKIIKILKDERPFLEKRFKVKRLALFGSFAKGNPGKNSDVDILVEYQGSLGMDFFRLSEHLEKKLGRKVDILTPGGIKGIRIKSVAKDIQKSLIYV